MRYIRQRCAKSKVRPTAFRGYAGEETAPLDGLSQRHLALVEGIAQNGRTLTPALGELLEKLQEAFMAFLNGELAAAGVSLSGRMHLHLSPDGRLVVEGDDNEVESLCKILSANSFFKQRFQELSRLALLTAGLETFCNAHKASGHAVAIDVPLDRYHLCFKNSLSHFFIK